MSNKPRIGDRLVLGAMGALFQHVVETTPELRTLSQAAGYTAPVARNQMLHDAIDDAAEALEDLKVPAKKKRRPKKCEAKPPPTKKAADEDVIDMEKKPDGSYGAKA